MIATVAQSFLLSSCFIRVSTIFVNRQHIHGFLYVIRFNRPFSVALGPNRPIDQYSGTPLAHTSRAAAVFYISRKHFLFNFKLKKRTPMKKKNQQFPLIQFISTTKYTLSKDSKYRSGCSLFERYAFGLSNRCMEGNQFFLVRKTVA